MVIKLPRIKKSDGYNMNCTRDDISIGPYTILSAF